MATSVFNTTIATGNNANTTAYEVFGYREVTFFIVTDKALTGTITVTHDNASGTKYSLWEPDASALYSYSLAIGNSALTIPVPGCSHVFLNLANASGTTATITVSAQRANVIQTRNGS